MQSSKLLVDCCSYVARARGALVSHLGDDYGFGTVIAGLVSLAGGATIAVSAAAAGGDLSFKQMTDVIDASIGRVSGSLEVRGSVIARSADSRTVDSLEFSLGVFGDGNGVSLDPASPPAERLVVSYFDGTDYHPDVPYTARFLGGDGDTLLEPGEMASITLGTGDIDGVRLEANERVTLELSAPLGGTIDLSRRLPYALQPVMSLH